jgi:hypothetical protein
MLETHKMKVKCVTTRITVWHCGGGHHQEDLTCITVGNVYETTGNKYSSHYWILHDHGRCGSQIPCYCFEETDEPVTINPNREAEIAAEIEKCRQLKEENYRIVEQERIRDNMDQYYNPSLYNRRKATQNARVHALQKVFVGGIPYD